MKRFNKVLSFGAVSLLGVAVLAGCSSSDDTAVDPVPASEEATADPAGDGVLVDETVVDETVVDEGGMGAQMLPPVIVTPDLTEVSANVGEMLDIIVTDPLTEVVSVDDPSVLSVTQGSDDGSAVFNPGAQALAAGTAVLTITDAAGGSRQVVVSVS
jgi:hypothetical protein